MKERRRKIESCVLIVCSDTVMEQACCCTKHVINLSKDSWLFHMFFSFGFRRTMWMEKKTYRIRCDHIMFFYISLLSVAGVEHQSCYMHSILFSSFSKFLLELRVIIMHNGILCVGAFFFWSNLVKNKHNRGHMNQQCIQQLMVICLLFKFYFFLN